MFFVEKKHLILFCSASLIDFSFACFVMRAVVSKADFSDIDVLLRLVSAEFSYKGFTKSTLLRRLSDNSVFVFKLTLGRKFLGFIDVDLSKDVPLISAISVVGSHRGKGFGKKLLSFALSFVSSRGYGVVRLLVRSDNFVAKSLYSSLGFSFVCFHERKINGKVVEVWEKKLC